MFSGKLGRLEGVEHDIDVQGHAPITQSYYRMAPDKVEVLKAEIDQMLELGVIQPSQSPWASPIILVKKPNGEWRPCIDYRRINEVTKSTTYPIPRIEDLIDRVANANVITTLDLNKGYWQIPLTPAAREIAAFITPFGLYEPVTLPFGLKGAPMTFQRTINDILSHTPAQNQPYRQRPADAYLDDIAVQSADWEKHLVHLDQTLYALDQRGVTLNPEKCKIASGTVHYLGHELGSGRVSPIPSKCEAIQQIPTPTTKKQLRSFLGTIGFYRRFIPKFSGTAAPLTDLLSGKRKGDISRDWGTPQQTAFEALKEALAGYPVLKAPDFSRPFEIYSDAADTGIAAVLMQEHDKVPLPVAYYSRKLLPRERNYSAIEKELLALISALTAYRVYVGSGPVTVYTDHNPLVWLNKTRSTNQRLLRWSLCLSEFLLTIRHIKGKDNILCDFLSRNTAP